MLVNERHKKLILKTSRAAEILEVIPHAKEFELEGEMLVAVPHKIEESMVLKNLGFKKTPAPILHYYDFPARFKAMAKQKRTSAFLTMNKRALCLNSPGSGKSVSSLWAADYLLECGLAKRILIIAPLSTVKVVWGKELNHHFSHRSFQLVVGSKEQKQRALAVKGTQYFITNHDGFTSMAKELVDFDVVIYDEATALKNPASNRFKLFFKWVNIYNPWLWLLTGTPISQSPVDAWTLARLVNNQTVPKSYTAFKDLVMNKISTFKWVPKPNALDVCMQVLQPSIRFSLDEFKELPDTVYLNHECPMSVNQKKAYKEMREQAVLIAHDVSAPNAAVVMQKLLQICCIAKDTLILSDSGWKYIQDIKVTDLLWDGVEWVSHDGLLPKGRKETIVCAGVSMTHAHEVLSTEGWKSAKEIADGKFAREKVRIPIGNRPRHADIQVQVGCNKSVADPSVEVYDIANCGPRNRFVVSSHLGELSIVHNCGCVYGAGGERFAIDFTERYNVLVDIIEEIGGKVIIFVPFRGVQDALNDLLSKHYKVAVVHGGITGKTRNDIFDDFQNPDSETRILLAHPKVAAHGLTLTSAKDIIWFAPIYSLEMYEQANARIRRLTTRGKTRVHHLYSTALEKELYSRLIYRKQILTDFLGLINGVND